MSQEKFALLCNIDRSYFGRIERGRDYNLTLKKTYELANALETFPSNLLP
ncbi:helix-turn-helix transcriptional regulator [Proteus mirabilis]|nr:helix-turn-helix transcriptional regulator [Proteus mirabilis]MBG2823476.1 helix-turn-helix transcriptional regulator [Proteus mirabilis]